ncbi:MAG: hexulose-6-phosphate synthase [Rickettsiales bacterium]|nr:MAG: hexulose-6-phosphate synthase [Rickettsiales bacterium]
MSRLEKLIVKLKRESKDFSWNELIKLLTGLDFTELSNGKTGGSRRKFYHEGHNIIINLHKPHPSPYLKEYALKQIRNKLSEEQMI